MSVSFLHVLMVKPFLHLQEFHGMDPDVLQKSLHVLVRRGKAQVFGNEDQQGVKFF